MVVTLVILLNVLVSEPPILIYPQIEYIYAAENGLCVQDFAEIDEFARASDKLLTYCDSKGNYKSIVAQSSGNIFYMIRAKSFSEGELLVGLKPSLVKGIVEDARVNFKINELFELCIDNHNVEIEFTHRSGKWAFFKGTLENENLVTNGKDNLRIISHKSSCS